MGSHKNITETAIKAVLRELRRGSREEVPKEIMREREGRTFSIIKMEEKKKKKKIFEE